MVSGYRIDIDQQLERAVRIARAIDKIADCEHAASAVLGEQSSRSLQGRILAMDVTKDTYPANEHLYGHQVVAP